MFHDWCFVIIWRQCKIWLCNLCTAPRLINGWQACCSQLHCIWRLGKAVAPLEITTNDFHCIHYAGDSLKGGAQMCKLINLVWFCIYIQLNLQDFIKVDFSVLECSKVSAVGISSTTSTACPIPDLQAWQGRSKPKSMPKCRFSSQTWHGTRLLVTVSMFHRHFCVGGYWLT